MLYILDILKQIESNLCEIKNPSIKNYQPISYRFEFRGVNFEIMEMCDYPDSTRYIFTLIKKKEGHGSNQIHIFTGCEKFASFLGDSLTRKIDSTGKDCMCKVEKIFQHLEIASQKLYTDKLNNELRNELGKDFWK